MRLTKFLFLMAPLAVGLPLAVNSAEISVKMAGGQYGPGTVTAAVGDVLKFENYSGDKHGVFSPTTRYAVDIGNMKPGESASLALGRNGLFEVESVYHPDMLLKVEVK